MLGKLAPLSPATNLTAGQQRLIQESQDGIVRALSRSYQEAQLAAASLSKSQHEVGATLSAASSPLDAQHSGSSQRPRRLPNQSPQLDASRDGHGAGSAPLVGSEAASAKPPRAGSAVDRFDDIQSDEDNATPAPVTIVNRTPRFTAGKFHSPLDGSGAAMRSHVSTDVPGTTRDALLVSSFSPGTSFNPAVHQRVADVGTVGLRDDAAQKDSGGLSGAVPMMSIRSARSWEPLPVQASDLETLLTQACSTTTNAVDIPCPAGFTLTVYNGDISQHFNLPSETVQITRGSIKYVDHHARYGPQTRFRFQLCHNYLQRKCTKLSECSYIHATVLPKPSEVHLNPFAPRRLAADRHGHGQDVPLSAQDDPSVAETYDTLPPGIVLTVYAPNAGTAGSFDVNRAPQHIPSEMIIKTVGAETALAALQAQRVPGEVRPTTGSRPRHCAHYQFKRLCNLGTQCHFIHSKVPFADAESTTQVASKAPAAVPTQSAAAPYSRTPANGLQQQTSQAVPPSGGRGPHETQPRALSATSQPYAPPYVGPSQQYQPVSQPPMHAPYPPPPSLLNAGMNPMALQQYLAAGTAADPNFLAGMQYAAQLLAMQQHPQSSQFAPPMNSQPPYQQHQQQMRYPNNNGNVMFPPMAGVHGR